MHTMRRKLSSLIQLLQVAKIGQSNQRGPEAAKNTRQAEKLGAHSY